MGWKITRDFISKEDEQSMKGINSSDYEGGKIKCRLLDDDKNVYFHAVLDDETEGDLGELLDWSMRNFGCTRLEMKNDNGKWELVFE